MDCLPPAEAHVRACAEFATHLVRYATLSVRLGLAAWDLVGNFFWLASVWLVMSSVWVAFGWACLHTTAFS